MLESPLVLGGTELLLAGLVLATFPNDSPRWGFSSPSRFTERYGAAFGTTPSTTLRR